MGRALAVLIWLIAIVSVYLFISGHWWFPEVASEHGVDIDRQFALTIVVVGIAFFAAQAALGYTVFRYGERRGAAAVYSHGNNRLEVIWTIVTAVVFIGVAIMGQKVWAQLHFNDAPPDALQVEVMGQQFAWNIRYPGPDGKFGRTDPKQINDVSNPVGIDRNDPDGKDDIVTINRMAVPVGRPVRVILRSKDVTHSYFVPSMRIKQDAVPGMVIGIHFKPTKAGIHEIACAELCGMNHYKMRGTLEVMSQQEFENFLKERSER